MLKIFTAEQIRQADVYSISKESISSIDLMERAAMNCAKWIINAPFQSSVYKIFCGPGNNGGDGLAIARLLYLRGKNVEVYLFAETKNYSADFKINYERLCKLKSIVIRIVSVDKDFPFIGAEETVVDALFGSGLNRKPEGLIARLIKHINQSSAPVISIDIPSGMFPDRSADKEYPIIKANHTLTFQFPKLSFLFAENGMYIGDMHILDIGLHKEYIEETPTKNFLLEDHDIRLIKKVRRNFSHKGNYGHALIISGSYGKMGAAVLSSKACISAGAGLVTASIPGCGYAILQTAVPEIMVVTDESENFITQLTDISTYNSIGVGPGIGTAEETGRMIKILIQNCNAPIVFDADALNLLSENKTWLSFLPPGCILTPHPGEFERLVGKWSDGFERQQLQLDFSRKYRCYIVLKDHYSCVSCPDGSSYFNPTGNPGMATAGSGDVLTGMLTGLLAQGYSPRDAALLGVYIHGLSGDFAAAQFGMESMMATHIIENIGKAYLYISGKNKF